MPSPGERAKFLNAADILAADSVQPTRSIELNFALSPKKKNLVSAIVIFKRNEEDFDLTRPPKDVSAEMLEEMKKSLQNTQVMERDPEYDKDKDPVALLQRSVQRMYELFDEFNSDATFAALMAVVAVVAIGLMVGAVALIEKFWKVHNWPNDWRDYYEAGLS